MLQKKNQNVKVVPTCIVYSNYDNLEAIEEDNLSIGWLGTAYNQGYLKDIKDELKNILIQYPQVTLKVISNNPMEISGVKIENIKWNIDTYMNDLLKINIGIMPLRNDDWSRGKCAFKLIQYMAAGLPVIASNVGTNSTLITDGEDGYLVNSSDEWLSGFENLLESEELRKKMGMAAKKKIRQNYSSEAWFDRYETLLLDDSR